VLEGRAGYFGFGGGYRHRRRWLCGLRSQTLALALLRRLLLLRQIV